MRINEFLNLPAISKSARKTGDSKWQALCPAHDDKKTKSLSIGVGTDGRILLHCQGKGCSVTEICKMLLIKPKDLFPSNGQAAPSKKQIVKTYDYNDEAGQLLFQAVRYEPKDFRQRRPDGKGGWIWNLGSTRRVLYRLPELLKANGDSWIFVVEGEKDVDSVTALDLPATTNPMGAKKWRESFNEFLKNRRVAIVPDNDEAGRVHVEAMARSIGQVAQEVRIIELPGLLEKGDATNWIEAGGTKEQLLKLVEQADTFKPSNNGTEQPRKSFHDEIGHLGRLTDAGNARRMVSQHSGLLRHNWTISKWAAYDGKRWNYDTGIVTVTNLALKTIGGLFRQAKKCEGDDVRKKLNAWAHKSEKTANVNAMIALARVLAPIAAYAEDFNKDPFLLNVIDGTVDLRTGDLRPHNPDDMITQLAPVEYQPNQKKPDAPLWFKCLDTWHRGDKDTIDYLQRLAGLCLTGDTTSRVFPIFHGSGKNGKSVFLDTLMLMLGDYATVAPRTLLKVGQYEEHPTELAGLVGKRFVVASETSEDMKLRLDLIKAMTGDQMMRARLMQKDYFEFTPTFKTILVTQNLPTITESSDAIWDRVQKVEWGVRIPDDQQDTNLIDKLKAERTGILRWAINGCLRWQNDGILVPTEAIRMGTNEYKNDQNPLAQFIEEECIVSSKDVTALVVPVAELKSVYDVWARLNGYDDKLSAAVFSKMLRKSGYTKMSQRVHGKVVKCWIGIGLCADSDEI